MAITLLQPLPAGNAMRVFITPPPGALYWRLLRRTADVFTGPDDTGAVSVADKTTDNVVLDAIALVNGTPYFWRCYAWNGSGWDNGGTSVTAIPAVSYAGDECDPLQILRDRLEAGLAVEVQRGALLPNTGKIPVLKSPFILSDQLVFPTVFVHYDTFAPAERAIGDEVLGLEHGLDTGWTSSEGFLARSSINIGSVSRLPDERNALRRALTRVLQANFGVFAGLGLNLVEFSLGDSEDLTAQAAPLFMTGGTFSCVSHSFVRETADAIEDVIVTVHQSQPEPSYG